jgi:hypothetical protein
MQESRKVAYTTDITTLINQGIAAPGNRLSVWSASRQALCNLGRNCGMGRGGEKFREEKTILSQPEWEPRFLRHPDRSLVTTMTEL